MVDLLDNLLDLMKFFLAMTSDSMIVITEKWEGVRRER
jgi:hypothetical protein